MFQKLDLLLGLYIAAIVSAELLGSKTFSLLGINASVAIFIFPLTFTINDIVAEVYGKERARSFMQVGLIILILLAIYTTIAIHLPPTQRFSPYNTAYNQVFGKSQRIIIASLIAYWISERMDIHIFTKIRNRIGKSKLWLRNNLSNILSQLVDTSLFMILAFYMPGNSAFVISLIIPYWLLKCAFSIVQTPLTY